MVQTAASSKTSEAEPVAFRLTGFPATTRVSPDIEFVEGRGYYQLVMTFLAATAGLTPVFDAEHHRDFLVGTAGVYRGVVAGDVSIDLHAIIATIRGGAISATDAVNSLCCMLANAAWEQTPALHKGSALFEDPEVQFSRHLRHGASHGNAWHFMGREPKLPACWRSVKIDHELKSYKNPLHGRQLFGSDFAPADLIVLLYDIERKLSA